MNDQQFEFEIPGTNRKVYTGNIVPETYPVSFKPYPEEQVRSLEEIAEIISNPQRRPSTTRWGQNRLMNQGQRGSCNAYMATGMLARVIWLQTGVWYDLGPEFLYMHINGGRDRGSLLDDGMKRMTDYGICERGLVPYESYRKSEVPNYQRATENALNYRAMECYQTPTDSIEKSFHALLSGIAGRGIGGVAVHVGNQYMRSGETAGFDRGMGNHAVCVDDIVLKTSKPRSVEDFHLKSPQSWGLDFADRGWTNLTIRHLEQTYKYHGFYMVRSAIATADDMSTTKLY